MFQNHRRLRLAAAAWVGASVLGTGAALASGLDTTSVRFIDGWSLAGHNTLIVHTLGHDYRAELLPGCNDLDFSVGLRFVPSGRLNDEFDRFGHIVTSDGTRCYLKSFEEVPRQRPAK